MNIQTTRKQNGFTIVELLIVIVVISILAGLVLNTFNSIRSRERDTDRKNSIRVVHNQLESYYADKGFYPTTANMGDAAWLTKNMPGLDTNELIDPLGGNFSYKAKDNCNNEKDNLCENYTLSADLEEDGRGEDDADANVADFQNNSSH